MSPENNCNDDFANVLNELVAEVFKFCERHGFSKQYDFDKNYEGSYFINYDFDKFLTETSSQH